MTSSKRLLAAPIGAVGVVLMAAIAPAATAAPPPERPFDHGSAVAQYVESIPTAAGPVAARGTPPPGQPPPEAPSGEPGPPSSLAPEAREALAQEGGDAASILEQVATSPAYGAPQVEPRELAAAGELAGEPSAVSGVVRAPAEEPRIALLLGMFAAGTIIAAALYLRRAVRRG